MKTLLLIFAFAIPIFAQNPASFTVVQSDPTGNGCGSNSVVLRTPNGTIYTCQNGAYAAAGSGSSANVTFCSGSASATAATCTGTPAPTSYTALTGSFQAGAASTGSPLTLNINSLGAKNVYLNGVATSATN